MGVLVHLSDLHFGTEVASRVAAVEALVRAQAPDLVVVSGDLTQRARRRQFARAAAFLRRLGAVPALLVPGNHDLPLYNLVARLGWPRRGFTRAFGPVTEPRFEGAALSVIGVDTTRRWRHRHGEVSAGQVRAVGDWLRRQPTGHLRVVVTHHPVAHAEPASAGDLLRGREAAVAAWAEAGCDLVLSGHLHDPDIVPLHQVLPGLPRRVWSAGAGTAVSARLRADEPASLHVIRRTGAACWRVERWDHPEGVDGFGPVQAWALDLDRAGGGGEGTGGAGSGGR